MRQPIGRTTRRSTSIDRRPGAPGARHDGRAERAAAATRRDGPRHPAASSCTAAPVCQRTHCGRSPCRRRSARRVLHGAGRSPAAWKAEGHIEPVERSLCGTSWASPGPGPRDRSCGRRREEDSLGGPRPTPSNQLRRTNPMTRPSTVNTRRLQLGCASFTVPPSPLLDVRRRAEARLVQLDQAMLVARLVAAHRDRAMTVVSVSGHARRYMRRSFGSVVSTAVSCIPRRRYSAIATSGSSMRTIEPSSRSPTRSHRLAMRSRS